MPPSHIASSLRGSMPKRECKTKLRGLPQRNSAATPPGRWSPVLGESGSLRKRKGPVPGTLDRYGKEDRALYPELERLMHQEHMSLTAAARQLADNSKVAGIGTAESRARRLAKRYGAEER
jgi:hypothetical protein